MHTPEYLVAGCGAIGSHLEAAMPPHFAVTFADNQCVMPENVSVSAFTNADLGQQKADVLAARHRTRDSVARALHGDLRYTLRPGLMRALTGAVICLDNARAIFDATEALWTGAVPGLPIVALTCGSDVGSYQARVFVPPGVCPVCLFGDADRRSDRTSTASCADTSAPRASAAAATAAARAGATLITNWLAGDRSLANCRLQRDAGTDEDVIRMPATPSPLCPIHHGDTTARAPVGPVIDLGAPIAAVTVGALAETAIRYAGADAEFILGRRAVPLSGLYCPRCRISAPAASRLLPAAQSEWHACNCGVTLYPLGECHTISARTLQMDDVAALSLATWGAGHGDQFTAVGAKGRVQLRCTFDWRDLDGDCA